MARGDRERWDERHRGGTGGEEPPEWLVLAEPELPRHGTVLDLACGGGQALRWLAQRGLPGTGVEVSPVALAAARVRCAGLPVVWVEQDTDTWDPGDQVWDVVLCLRYWSPPLVSKMRRATREGGCLVIEVLTRATSARFGADPGELLRVFSDWRVIDYREHSTSPVARLLARRPG